MTKARGAGGPKGAVAAKPAAAPPPPAPAPEAYAAPAELEIAGAKSKVKQEKKTPSSKAKQQDKRVRPFGTPGDVALAPGVPAESETPVVKGGRQRKLTYQEEIKKMMFTFGDARQTDPASSELVEDAVRHHIIDLAVRAAELVREKGHSSRSTQAGVRITIDEILFLIRSDVNTHRRVQEYLAWKDVRRRLQKASDKAEAVDEGADDEDDDEAAEAAAEADAPAATLLPGAADGGGTSGDPEILPTAGAPLDATQSSNGALSTRPAKSREPVHPRDKQQMGWDLPEVLAAEAGVDLRAADASAGQAAGSGPSAANGHAREEHSSSSAPAAGAAHSRASAAENERLRRLRLADELTKRMTRDEYEDYTECRQASFSYKKAKRFREWARFAEHNVRVADDLIDVLGFLAWETVGRITEAALRAQRDATSAPRTQPPAVEPTPQESADAPATGATSAGEQPAPAADATPAPAPKTEGEAGTAAGDEGASGQKKRTREGEQGEAGGSGEEDDLMSFMPRHDNKHPVREEHIREAIRRLDFVKRRRLSDAA